MGVLLLEATGLKLGTTGLSTSYDDDYPPELEGVLNEEEWTEAIQRINRAFQDRFPCGPCRLQSYCCCPCTLGLSLLCIRSQAKEIERGVGVVIGNVNYNLKARGRDVRFSLKRKCCRSWVQVDYGSSTLTSTGVHNDMPIEQSMADRSGGDSTREAGGGQGGREADGHRGGGGTGGVVGGKESVAGGGSVAHSADGVEYSNLQAAKESLL